MNKQEHALLKAVGLLKHFCATKGGREVTCRFTFRVDDGNGEHPLVVVVIVVGFLICQILGREMI